jgi:cardiolipin synthase A/B
MKLMKVVSIGLGILVLAGLALIGVLSMTRGTPISGIRAVGRTGAPPRVGDTLFVRTMELYTGLHVEGGNHVDVMLNGDGSYPQLWKDIAGAQKSITIQLYYCQPGTTADSMAMFLSERARAGVRIQLLLDAFGAQNLTKEWRQGLKDAGVTIAELRPLHWYTLHQASNRSHVRAIIVDGVVGWTGGFGLADYWQGDGLHKDQWRDTNVRFTGPAVAQLQAAFITAWAEATSELLTGDFYFPRKTFVDDGGLPAGLLMTSPTIGSTAAERFVALTISGAQRTLYIANSYFVPDDDFRDLLIAARKRGVDVRILTAGEETDIKSTRYAGRARYEQLLRAGIRIFEYQPTMIHSKTIVADGMWTTIGSLNFDNRSLAFNNESSLAVLDSAFGALNDSLYLADLAHSKEILLPEFEQRGTYERMMERGANLLSRIL